MVLFNLVPRNTYHKNGTQWIGKIFNRIMGESLYEKIRLEKRILYGRFWYNKQNILYRFQQQYPHFAVWFSLLNKKDTSNGFPARRQYERHQDFAVYNINHEGWFQFYFILATFAVLAWNYWVIAVHYDISGVTPEDQDLFRYKDARVTTNFDRTKYNFNYYFFGTHYNASVRRLIADKDHPDDPRVNFRPSFSMKNPYGEDRYVKYYGEILTQQKLSRMTHRFLWGC
jgi:hypothetical protein